jgi:integrase
MKTWTREDLTLFLRLTEVDSLHPLWRLLSMTGLRRGEALGLRWTDMDMDGGLLAVRRSRVQVGYEVQESDTKTGRSRVVAVDAGTIDALRHQAKQQRDNETEWREAWQGDGHIFTREDGAPWQPDRISKLFNQAVKASGLPRIRLHDLRHTHATLALQAGIHPKVVSERLGHANISMTLDTYSHAIPVLQESAAALIAALIDVP